MRYAAYGHTFDSALALPELPERADAGDAAPDVSIRAASTLPAAPSTRGSTPRPRGREPWLRVAAAAEGYLLRFGRATTFGLSRDAGTVLTCIERRDVGLTDTVRHLLVDQVLPLALSHRGRLVLHGSAVVIDGRAVAFVGPGGAGKSTLTASLAAGGAAVLADDALVTGADGAAATIHASYPALRLWPDAAAGVGGGAAPPVAGYTEKRRLGRGEGLAFVADAAPIARLYVVGPRAARRPRIDALSKREAVMALLTHSYVLDTSAAERLGEQLNAACRLVDAVPVRALTYPRRFDRLPEVRDAILRDLRA